MLIRGVYVPGGFVCDFINFVVQLSGPIKEGSFSGEGGKIGEFGEVFLEVGAAFGTGEEVGEGGEELFIVGETSGVEGFCFGEND